MRLVGLAALALCFGLVQPAYADLVDVRTQQLRGASDYKVRLSAVLWLAKKADDRSIAALTGALASDSEHTIRRIAAGALGTLITARTGQRVRDRAVAALQKAASRDRNSRVRRSARRSLKRVAALRPSAAVARRPGGQVFINVERPSLGKHRVPARTREDLQERVRGVLQRAVPAYLLSWKSGRLPTKSDLDSSGTRGWFVGATLSQLRVSKRGARADVQCEVTMRINRWEGRDTRERLVAHETASAKGKGQIRARNSKRAIEGAARECVLEVTEQLTAKQVVPFLKQKNP